MSQTCGGKKIEESEVTRRCLEAGLQQNAKWIESNFFCNSFIGQCPVGVHRSIPHRIQNGSLKHPQSHGPSAMGSPIEAFPMSIAASHSGHCQKFAWQRDGCNSDCSKGLPLSDFKLPPFNHFGGCSPQTPFLDLQVVFPKWGLRRQG